MVPVIDRMALSVAESIKKVDAERTPSVDVMKFSLYILIHTLFTVILICIVSLIDGKFLLTIAGLGYLMLLRQFSGGYHVHSSWLCTILSVILVSLAPFVPLDTTYIYLLTAVNAVMMLLFAPSHMKGYSRVPEKYYVVLKIIAFLIVCANFGFTSATLSIVALFQSILLIIKEKGGNPT